MRIRTAEDNSTSKRLTTALTFFSTTVPAARRLKVLSEAKPLLTAHLRSKEIWSALQMADYKKEGALNDAAVAVLFESQTELFKDLLLVNSPEELQELLDEDEDGFLNEDEQILIFSLIKERMQEVAEELCAIHEYSLYKDMMRGIRLLEVDVLEYQEKMRKRNHRKELSAYHEAGMEKLQKFKEDWDRKFETFQRESQGKMNAMKELHDRQTQELNDKLQKDVEFMKVKPKARMRDLQTQEKLVAVNERYGEAQHIRNELKVLEVDEQNRVENKVLQEQENKRKKLKKHQDKEITELQLKNQTGYYSLKIRMDQQYTRLQKEIKLYLNDITKNQNLALRLARKMGETRDELRRTKKKAKVMMRFMMEAKTAPSTRTRQKTGEGQQLPTQPSPLGKAIPHGSVISTTVGRARTSSPLKRNMRNITKFQISNFFAGAETPVASKKGGQQSVGRGGVQIPAIQSAKKSVLKSLSGLYDEDLHPLADEGNVDI